MGFLLGSLNVCWALTSENCYKGLPKSSSGEVITFKGEWYFFSFVFGSSLFCLAYQSCQPLCFGCSLLRLCALCYAAVLMMISLWPPPPPPPPKTKKHIEFLCVWIPCLHVGIKNTPAAFFTFVVLVVPQPISVHLLNQQ